MSTLNFKKCPNCGAIREANDLFCGTCGNPFGSSRDNYPTPPLGGWAQSPITPTEPALPPFRPKSQRKYLIIAIAGLVVMLISALFIGVQLGKGNSQGTISNTPTTPNSATTTLANSTPTATLSPTPTPTPTPQVNILASGQRYDGTFTQDKRQISLGNQLIGGTWDTTFSISDMSGNTFDGTLNLHTLGELGVKGMMMQDVNSVSGSYDQQRFKELIDKYGSDGIFIQFTATRLISGDNLIMNCTYYALVGSDGTIQGLWFYPIDSKWSCAGGVFCSSGDNNIPGGNFTFHKSS